MQGAFSTSRADNWRSRWNTCKAISAKKEARAGEQAYAAVQALYAKANLPFIYLCCPTPVLKSIAIESVIAHDLAKGLDHLAMYWTKELAPLNKATGLWRSVGSSNLMSGFVPDSLLALVFKQRKAAIEA